MNYLFWQSRMLSTLIIIAFAFVIVFIFPTSAQAQTGVVSGFVFDKNDGESLIGANIIIKELKIGSATNASGYFVIPEVPAGEYTVFCSYIGYNTETQKIAIKKNDDKIIEFRLRLSELTKQEIVVAADSIRTIEKLFSRPISKIEMNQQQVNRIPRVIEADLLRSLQTLPGITALSDFSSALYVRGGTPDQNLYVIDGADVYNPEHLFGIFSTFNTNAIKKVELSKGGFGAEFGGRLSSVLNVTNLDGNRNNFEGQASVSILAASTTLQMPVSDIGSVSVSLRRTYIDQTYAKWIKEVPDYYFYDGTIKAYFDLDLKNKLTFSFFAGKDKLDFKVDKNKPSFGFYYDWGNTTTSLNWKHIFSSQLYSSFWTTFSYFNSNFDMQASNFIEKNRISDLSVKGQLEYYFMNDMHIKFGFEQKFLSGALQENWESGLVDVSKTRTHTIGYISSSYSPLENLQLEFGLRYNYFNSEADYQNIEPRLSAKYRMTETTNLKFAAGTYHQFVHRIPRLFFSSLWTSSDENVGQSESDHYILGFQKEIEFIYQLEIETYYKSYRNIYQYNQLMIADIKTEGYRDGLPMYGSTKGLFNSGEGSSYGLEVLFKRDVGSVTGWLAYSLSRTEYTFPALNHGKEYIPRHDRSSVINAVLNINVNQFLAELNDEDYEHHNDWLVSLNFIYATGQPITVPASAYFISFSPDWNIFGMNGENNPGYALYPSEIDKYRLPAYIRLDLSVTKDFDMGGWSLSPYLQIINAGNRKNLWFISYKSELIDGVLKQSIDKVNMLPLLPSIGVNFKF